MANVAESIDRCRLVLTASPENVAQENLLAAASGGFLASCILYQGSSSEADFGEACQRVVPLLQEKGVAVLIADNTQIVGRSGADGIFLEKSRDQAGEILSNFSPDQIVGCGNLKTRHMALEIGEAKPDFVFFGKLGKDIRPDAHPKNLAIAEWWSEIIEIPSIVLAGNSLDSIIECAKTGADFVAVEAYALDPSVDPASAIKLAEEQLENHAPRFEEVSA
ncbi:MAG: thiamine phosphate synthase [Rhizobiaceae bacterium]